MHSPITWDNRILPKYPDLLVVETYPNKKDLWDSIFFNVIPTKTVDCSREIITKEIYYYLFKLAFLAKQMGVNNFMVEKNSAIMLFFTVHNDKIILNAKKKPKTTIVCTLWSSYFICYSNEESSIWSRLEEKLALLREKFKS